MTDRLLGGSNYGAEDFDLMGREEIEGLFGK